MKNNILLALAALIFVGVTRPVAAMENNQNSMSIEKKIKHSKYKGSFIHTSDKIVDPFINNYKNKQKQDDVDNKKKLNNELLGKSVIFGPSVKKGPQAENFEDPEFIDSKIGPYSDNQKYIKKIDKEVKKRILQKELNTFFTNLQKNPKEFIKILKAVDYKTWNKQHAFSNTCFGLVLAISFFIALITTLALALQTSCHFQLVRKFCEKCGLLS